jgi:hypothetical protein
MSNSDRFPSIPIKSGFLMCDLGQVISLVSLSTSGGRGNTYYEVSNIDLVSILKCLLLGCVHRTYLISGCSHQLTESHT